MAADHHDLLGRVSGLVAACTRRVSRATHRLLRQHRRSFLDKKRKHANATGAGAAEGGGSEVALWSRRILMGERCQPLDFAGAIHYDSFGRRLATTPTPRSASSLSLSSDSFAAVSDAISDQHQLDV